MAESQTTQSQRSLAALPLLAGLSPAGLKDIEQRCSWRRYEPGEPIVEYLDRSDDVFFLVEGEARVII
jgi:CRP-like cAMP-binding protein